MINNLEVAQTIKYCLLLIAYGLGGTQFTNIPILFFRPEKVIPDLSQPEEYYFSNKYPQITSIPMILDLYGEREYQEIIIMTSGYIGKFVAYILLVAFPVKESYEHYAIFTPILLIGLFTSFIGVCQHVVVLTISFFIWFGSFSYIIGQIFPYAYKNFSGKMSENSVFYLNVMTPIVMLIHIFYSYLDGHWRSNVVYFTGFSNLIIGISLFFLQRVIEKLEFTQQQNILNTVLLENDEQFIDIQVSQMNDSLNDQMKKIEQISHESPFFQDKNEDSLKKGDRQQNQEKQENQQNTQNKTQMNENSNAKLDILMTKENSNQTSYDILQDNITMFKRDVTQRNNIMIWSLVWNVVGVSFVGCVIAMNRLDGNLYFNLTISTVFELLGNIASLYLISKFSLKKSIIVCLYMMGISYIISVFLEFWSKNSDSSPLVQTLASIIPILVAKGTHEAMWNIVIEFQKQVIRVKYHQFSFAVANLFDMTITSTLPTYQYFMEKNGINQFIGYGIYSLIAAKAAVNFKIFNKGSFSNLSISQQSISRYSNSMPHKRQNKLDDQNNYQLQQIEEEQYVKYIEMDILSKKGQKLNQKDRLIAD